MKPRCSPGPQLALLLLLLLLTAARAEEKPAGLYGARDGVEILNFDDLETTVYGGSGHRVNWLLQIYHQYCGHCISYSRGFKKLARKLWPWRHTLRVGVINLADSRNTDVMTHYDFNTVPTLLFVSARCRMDEKYTAVLPSNTQTMIPRLLDQLEPFVPQLRPLSSGPAPDIDFLLEEASPGLLSRHVIMDTLADMQARWRPSDILPPGSVAVSRVAAGGGAVSPLGSAASLTDLHRFLGWRRRHRNGDGGGGNRDAKTPASASASVGAIAAADSPQPPTLTDLRSTLARALDSDVVLAGVNRSLVWRAVRALVSLVARLAPSGMSPPLARLAATLPSAAPADSSAWRRLLTDAGFPAEPPDQWDACQGSRPYLRGYPCGLWQLFHTLTALRVQAASAGRSAPAVGSVMRQFILTCFSCRHCAANFDRESADIIGAAEMSPRAELLWLWRLHNRVNARLKGQASEDPVHRKVQFPPDALCPTCHSDDDAAVEFLEQWYTRSLATETV